MPINPFLQAEDEYRRAVLNQTGYTPADMEAAGQGLPEPIPTNDDPPPLEDFGAPSKLAEEPEPEPVALPPVDAPMPPEDDREAKLIKALQLDRPRPEAPPAQDQNDILLKALGISSPVKPPSKADQVSRDMYYTFAGKPMPESAFQDGAGMKGGSNALGSMLKNQLGFAQLAEKVREFDTKRPDDVAKVAGKVADTDRSQGIRDFFRKTYPERAAVLGDTLNSIPAEDLLKLIPADQRDRAQEETIRNNNLKDQNADNSLAFQQQKDQRKAQEWVAQFEAAENERGQRQLGRTDAQFKAMAESTAKLAPAVDALSRLNKDISSAAAPGAAEQPLDQISKIIANVAPGVAGHILPEKAARIAQEFDWLRIQIQKDLFGSALSAHEIGEAKRVFANGASYTPEQMATAIQILKGAVYRKLATEQARLFDTRPDDFQRWRQVTYDTTFLNPAFDDVRPKAANAPDPRFRERPTNEITGMASRSVAPQGQEDESYTQAPPMDTSTEVRDPDINSLPGQRVVPNDGQPVGKNPKIPASPTQYRANHPSKPPPATNTSAPSTSGSMTPKRSELKVGDTFQGRDGQWYQVVLGPDGKPAAKRARR